MKKHNLLLAFRTAIILIGAFLVTTCTNAQTPSVDDSLAANVSTFDKIDQYVHDIELPETMEFCGEKVPLDRFDVREALEREILVNTYRHASTILLLKRTTRWRPVLEPIMRKNNLPEDFFYLSMIESDLTNAVSPSKAVGFWQFLESTAKYYNLKDLYNRFGSWTLAAAGYNCGGGRISRTIEEQGVNSYYDMLLPAETERYVYRILAFKLITENPGKYGFHISEDGWYQPLDYKTITVTESIPNLAQFALSQGTNLKMLKYYNPWLRSNSLTISQGNSYVIKLPR